MKDGHKTDSTANFYLLSFASACSSQRWICAQQLNSDFIIGSNSEYILTVTEHQNQLWAPVEGFFD